MKIITKLMNIKSADSVFGSMWIIGSFVGVVLFFQASFYGESWAPFVSCGRYRELWKSPSEAL